MSCPGLASFSFEDSADMMERVSRKRQYLRHVVTCRAAAGSRRPYAREEARYLQGAAAGTSRISMTAPSGLGA